MFFLKLIEALLNDCNNGTFDNVGLCIISIFSRRNISNMPAVCQQVWAEYMVCHQNFLNFSNLFGKVIIINFYL